MLIDYNKTAACVCPFCSTVSQMSLSAFDFSGGKSVVLKCRSKGCGEQCVTIAPKNKKYRIDAECPVCGGVHSFYIAADSVWKRTLVSFKCPESGIDIFFIGSSNAVNKKLDEVMKIYEELEAEYDDEPDLIYEILTRLNALAIDHKIKCRCGCEKIGATVHEDGIFLICSKCGLSRTIVPDENTLEQLLNAGSFILK